ncbi:STAS domain-containing protein [Endothiovibrio diazotrophicus]
MELQLDKSAEPWVLRPEGELTIFAAAELKQPLLDALNGAPGLTLDLSAVEELDTAGLQLLLLLAREARAAGTPFTLGPLSAASEEALALAGARLWLEGDAA